ncbi:MAG: DNA primase [Clostridia bacterium]|nr:DNA primase [Clostridia bacterium]
MAFPPEFIEEVKRRNSLVDVISGYVSLRRAGSNHVACCPFHNEKTPSFTVFERSDSFYCFGCGAGGDVITFIMKAENLDYPSAVEFLAKRAGLTVPDNGYDKSELSKKRKTLDLNKEAAKFFHGQLVSGKYPQAMEYVEKRRLGRAVRRFGLGYDPPNSKALANYLSSLGYTGREMNEAFLVNRGGYDIYGGRLIFPVIDAAGNVVAFGGRAMGNEKQKYINTTDTPAFNKRKNLYALNYAKNAKEDYFILCEGYVDVITLHLAGFSTAVASLGTSFTSEQAALMKKYKPKVVICYDGDAAGQNATQKAIALTTAAGLETKVLTIPGGLDPDEFIGKYGKENFSILLQNCYGQAEFRCEKALAKYDLASDEQRVAAAKETADIIASFPTAIEREIYGTKYAKKLGLSRDSYLETIKRKAERLQRARENEEKKKIIMASEGYGDRVNPDMVRMKKAANAEEALLGIGQMSPEFLIKAEESGALTADDFMTGFGIKIYGVMLESIKKNGKFDIALISESLFPEEVARVVRMYLARQQLHDNSYEVFLKYAAALREERNKQEKSDDKATYDDIREIINKKKKKNNDGGDT